MSVFLVSVHPAIHQTVMCMISNRVHVPVGTPPEYELRGKHGGLSLTSTTVRVTTAESRQPSGGTERASGGDGGREGEGERGKRERREGGREGEERGRGEGGGEGREGGDEVSCSLHSVVEYYTHLVMSKLDWSFGP